MESIPGGRAASSGDGTDWSSSSARRAAGRSPAGTHTWPLGRRADVGAVPCTGSEQGDEIAVGIALGAVEGHQIPALPLV